MTKKALTLSIIIPVYNEESHLKDCLNSIADQTEKPLEVLVIDNNSTDKSVEIAKSFAFVRVLSEKQQGVTYARNKGFNAAKGDIIGRIDADTVLTPTWAATVLDLFAVPDTAAVTGPVSYYDMPLEPVNFRLDKSLRWLVHKTQPLNWLFGTNMAIRKSAWQTVKKTTCVDSKIHEDLDLAIHLQEQKQQIVYDSSLRAGMSSRRFDDSLPAFYRYLQMHHITFKRHNIKTHLPHIAMVVYLFFYALVKPIRRSYDQATRTYSLHHFIYGYNQPRKNPME